MDSIYSRYEGNTRTTVGVVLSIIGISVAGLFKVVLGQNSNFLSLLVSFLAFFLVLNFSLRIKRFDKDMKAVSFFYLLTLFYAIISNRGFSAAHGLMFQLFYFLQIVCLWNAKQIDPDKFVRYLYFSLFGANLLGLYLVIMNATITGTIVFTKLGNNDMVTRATIGNLAYLLISACIVYKPQKTSQQFLKIFVWIVAIVNLILSTRRTAIIVSIAIIVIYMLKYHAKTISLRTWLRFVLVVGGGVLLFVLIYRMSATVKTAVDRANNMLVNGINTYFGVDATDMSASYRRMVLETKPDELIHQSSLNEILFGHGFMQGWFDIPFLQAFWDMGMLGGVIFLYIQLVLPIKYIRIKSTSPAINFAQCCVISRLINNIASGVCYGACFNLVLLMVLYRQSMNSYKSENPNERLISAREQ